MIKPTPCELGTYQDQSGMSVCSPCPVSFYCDDMNGTAVPKGCHPGAYCPVRSSAPYAHLCPSGTFSSRGRLSSIGDCESCTSGKYCEGLGLTVPSGYCGPGYFCGGGSNTRTPHSSSPFSTAYVGDTCVQAKNGTINDVCPPAHYCPEGSSSPVACPAGHNSSSFGQSSLNDCQKCPKGMYCPLPGTVIATRLCLEGYYCPSGTVNPTSTASLLCPMGNRCPEGSWAPEPCPQGSYQDEEGKKDCKVCPAGSYCGALNGTVIPTLCPAGSSCEEGSSTISPCPLGSYQDVVGSEYCKPCLEGHYCNEAGGTTPVPCTPGTYCPVGSTNMSPCKAGSYQNMTGSSDCQLCPSGYYCDDVKGTITPLLCLPGTVCPFGSVQVIILYQLIYMIINFSKII